MFFFFFKILISIQLPILKEENRTQICTSLFNFGHNFHSSKEIQESDHVHFLRTLVQKTRKISNSFHQTMKILFSVSPQQTLQSQ